MISEPFKPCRATVGHLKYSIDHRLNERLVDMKPEWDDSVTGFNEAWDIVRKVFADAALATCPAPEEEDEL